MSTNFGTNEASELLNMNMENISNELTALLGGGGAAAARGSAEMGGAVGGFGSAGLDFLGTRLNDVELLQCYRNYYYQQQQQQQQQRQLPATTLYSGAASAGAPVPSIFNTPPPPLAQPQPQLQRGQETKVAVESGSPPKFEFHYLRYQTFNKSNSNAEAVPLISSVGYADGGGASAREQHRGGGGGGSAAGASNGNGGRGGGGGFRKFQKPFPKYGNEAPLDKIDYDKVVVDLSLIGLSLDNKEKNPVLRLFGLFRKMHYFLNDVFPSGGVGGVGADDDVTTASYNSTATVSSMPCTMNVQYQVKQAARKCTFFLCDMQRILNANKLYDREKYLECERSLNGLRKLIVQFEMYKRVELEHKRGQFVTEDGRAQAERLELLMEQLNDKIRESHLYIHVFNWSVQRKNEMASATAYQQLPTRVTTSNDTASDGEGVRLTMTHNGSGGGGGGGRGPGGASGRGAHLDDQFNSASGTQSPIRNIG